MSDIVEPIGGVPAPGPVHEQEQGRGNWPEARHRTLTGWVVAVRPTAAHPAETHQLDVTVGGAHQHEVVIRVDQGNCLGLEGCRVVVAVEQD